jgi:hypothetical protein
MARHYWMICDHEMLGYYAIFKGLGQLKFSHVEERIMAIIGPFLDGNS